MHLNFVLLFHRFEHVRCSGVGSFIHPHSPHSCIQSTTHTFLMHANVYVQCIHSYSTKKTDIHCDIHHLRIICFAERNGFYKIVLVRVRVYFMYQIRVKSTSCGWCTWSLQLHMQFTYKQTNLQDLFQFELQVEAFDLAFDIFDDAFESF